MEETCKNLKELLPSSVQHDRISFQNAQWREVETKGKQMEKIDASSLPKRVRIIQDITTKLE